VSLQFLFGTDEFRRLLASLVQGEKGLRISGVTDSAKPYLLACLAAKLPKTIVCVRPPARPLPGLEGVCRFFLSQMGSSLGVNSLPALSGDPYLEIPPSLDAVSSRMKTFHGLIHGVPSLVLTNPFGLLKPIPRHEDLRRSFLRLAAGEPVERESLLKTLMEFGYSREDLIGFPGEYAWRGGIVDVFPPWQPYPLRIEIGAEAVTSLREFDTATQRSVRRLDDILVPSLREYPGSAEFIRSWTEFGRTVEISCRRDFEDKARLLKQGEHFPSFFYLSLLVRDRFVSFQQYFGDAVFFLEDRDEIEREWDEAIKEFQDHFEALRGSGQFALPPDVLFPRSLWKELGREALVLQELGGHRKGKAFSFGFQPVPKFNNRIPFFLDYLKKLQSERELCAVYLSNQGMRKRLAALIEGSGIPVVESDNPQAVPARGEVSLLLGKLEEGFAYPREKVLVFAEKDIFTEEKVIVSRATRKPFLSQFQDLQRGDYVVHTDYGIGVFHGLKTVDVEGKNREFIEILYRDNDRLLVPVEDLNLVQKFSKVGQALPPLDKLGTNLWQKTKSKTKKAVEAIAKELLELYARRKSVKGFSFTPRGEWETEFAKTFEFEETEDQNKSIEEIMKDMESDGPMDRLLCGDVGYGKTEVALRAAFKAVMDGKQVAVLCPTTVLASQHLKTFRSRMLLFPVRIEGLTRLQSRKEQKRILKDLAGGFVDILIGTHRILSKDVVFRDLGLLVVDEEQRFGVGHKEKIKQIRAHIDVLTLTATPIPRTLNMSLTGLRDISLIETPPRDRLSVHTVVTPFTQPGRAGLLHSQPHRGYRQDRCVDPEARPAGPRGRGSRADVRSCAREPHDGFHQ
jgi:transcription-repair coupling factor (superfamily II helicase)